MGEKRTRTGRTVWIGLLAAAALVACEAGAPADDPQLESVESGGVTPERVDPGDGQSASADSPSTEPEPEPEPESSDEDGGDGDKESGSGDQDGGDGAEPSDEDGGDGDMDGGDGDMGSGDGAEPSDEDGGDGAEPPDEDGEQGDPDGGSGDPSPFGCATAQDCPFGPCVQDYDAWACSTLCEVEEDCAEEGWTCDEGHCMPDFPLLCFPCVTSEDCWPGGEDDGTRCVVYGDEARFCGGPCESGDCPGDHSCWNVPDPSGEMSLQCIKAQGLCECSVPAIASGAQSACAVETEAGLCPGLRSCTAGGLGPCVAPEPMPETCNGLDDDCDGQTDESDAAGCTLYYADVDGDGAGAEDVPGQCLCGPAGPYTAHEADDCDDDDETQHPGAAELCNLEDDDCDGLSDETFGALGEPCDGDDEDSCAHGLFVCAPDGGGVACPTESETGLFETCNGLDDDCDGKLDEDFPNLHLPCDSEDADLCKNGIFTCTEGGDDIECVVELQVDLLESCNDVDDDCDGETDEDFGDLSTPCDTDDSDLCAYGLWFCTEDGGGLTCAAEAVSDVVELCNELDDDCDGLVDEDFSLGASCGQGTCAGGVMECTPDQTGSVCSSSPTGSAPKAGTETCNGLDDDCNSVIDNGAGCPCALHHHQGHAYRFCQDKKTWGQAKGACETHGYHLVTFSGGGEHGWVEGVADSISKQPWWIGMSDIAKEGTYVWVDGTPYGDYKPWAPGEPNNWFGEDCIEINRFNSATWNDYECSEKQRYICESP